MSSCSFRDPLQFFVSSAYQSLSSKPARYYHSELGYFSIDHDRLFSQNKSKLGILNLPPRDDCKNLDIDLNVGFEGWKNLPNVQQHLDSMLYWILLNKELMTAAGDFPRNNNCSEFGLNVDFVTSRGNLARILNVLNGKDGKGWTLLATRYRGTVYLSHIEADNDKDLSPFGRRVCYWGKRFEVEVTKERAPSERTERETVKHGPIKAYPGFFSVVRFQLENHSIALRTEVDAETQSVGEQPSEYVELKITTETIVRAHWAFNKKRLVPWWCQSIAAGIPLIVYGIRDYDGHVQGIEEIKTEEIPDRVGPEKLDSDKYLLFLSDMLSWIKNVVCTNEDDVYVISWDPNAHRMDAAVTANLLPRDTENAFLRDWYVREMENYFLRLAKYREKNWNDRAFETRDSSEQLSPRLPTAGYEKLMERMGSEGYGKGTKRKKEEVQKEHKEVEVELMNRRFEESWPRRKQPEMFSTDPQEHSGKWTSATSETYRRDYEEARYREKGLRYRESWDSSYDGERGRTTREAADAGSYSEVKSFKHEEHEREYTRQRKKRREEVRWISPSATERSDNLSKRNSRFRHPSSPYASRSRAARDDETHRDSGPRRTGHNQLLQGRERTRRIPDHSRPGRFRNESYCHSPSDERISDSRKKGVKSYANYNARRTRR